MDPTAYGYQSACIWTWKPASKAELTTKSRHLRTCDTVSEFPPRHCQNFTGDYRTCGWPAETYCRDTLYSYVLRSVPDMNPIASRHDNKSNVSVKNIRAKLGYAIPPTLSQAPPSTKNVWIPALSYCGSTFSAK
jgi:hypothetical protein